jgi:hypothetical protein
MDNRVTTWACFASQYPPHMYAVPLVPPVKLRRTCVAKGYSNCWSVCKLNISSPPTVPYSKLAIILQGFLGVDGDKGEKGRPGPTGTKGMNVSGLDHL